MEKKIKIKIYEIERSVECFRFLMFAFCGSSFNNFAIRLTKESFTAERSCSAGSTIVDIALSSQTFHSLTFIKLKKNSPINMAGTPIPSLLETSSISLRLQPYEFACFCTKEKGAGVVGTVLTVLFDSIIHNIHIA